MVKAVAMLKRLKAATVAIRGEVAVYRAIRQHPRTPKLAKALIGVAVAYAVSPIDLIPDFIPGIGHFDDAVIVPLLIVAALKLIPEDVIAECRETARRAPA